jgi:UDP-N-acetylglucosamine 2-epimerase (non-hydrolysing)
MRNSPDVAVHTLCTRQHPELLDSLLPLLDWVPDSTLNAPPQSDMSQRLCALLDGLRNSVEAKAFKPDLVLVQGDTFSTLAGAMMASYQKTPVVHLEAGLRTYDIGHPFPEEIHRQTLGRIASLHLAPTEQARDNLLKEGIAQEDVFVTGNTVVDALQMMRAKMRPPSGFSDFETTEFAVVTLHRREHAGTHALNIAEGLLEVQRRSGLEFVVVRHPNSEVSAPFCKMFEDRKGARVLPPLSYPEMLWLVHKARIVVTDSGGLQEEATAVGTPVGVVRRVTDRAEAVEAGCARLLGVEARAVCQGLEGMLVDVQLGKNLSQSRDIFGDGRASERAMRAISDRFGP